MDVFGSFSGLTKEQEKALIAAGAVNMRELVKNQLLLKPEEEERSICIVLSGIVVMENINASAQRRIVEYYGPQDIVWWKYLPDMEKESCYVMARSKCRAAFINEKKLLQHKGGRELQRELMERMIAQGQSQSMVHINILGQRTLRQKLLVFFYYLEKKREGGSFSLPFSYTDCADYLAADRSAMMRELGKMKEEGIVEVQGRRIRLEGSGR